MEEKAAIIIGKLMNIGGILQKEGNRLLAPYEMNQQQFSILFEIYKVGKVQQKDMINRLQLEKAHVSKATKKLQTMGLLEIHPNPNDQRSAFLSVTKKGISVVDECRTIFGQWNKDWLSTYHVDELQELLNCLDKLQKIFKENYTK